MKPKNILGRKRAPISVMTPDEIAARNAARPRESIDEIKEREAMQQARRDAINLSTRRKPRRGLP